MKHASEILLFLETGHQPAPMAIRQGPGHQQGETHTIKGNQPANQAAEKAAGEGDYLGLVGSLLPRTALPGYQLVYSNKDKEKAKECGLPSDQAGQAMRKDCPECRRRS